jgi:predicted PurR-regulated permease PerM
MSEVASTVRASERRRNGTAAVTPPQWQATLRQRSDIRTVALVPLLVSLIASYALTPVVDRLERWHLPRAIGAALVVLLLIIGGGIACQRLWDGADAILERLPAAMEKIRLGILLSQGDGTFLTHVQRTASELQRLAGATSPPSDVPSPPPPAWAVDARSILLMGTGSVVAAVGQLLSIIFLAYFLLAAGDLFRRKLVLVIGPPIAGQKAMLEMLDHIHHLNQRYLAVVALVNILIGLSTALGLGLIGVEHAALWGVAIAVLHFIPYLGAAVIATAVMLAAYIQFGSAEVALLAGAVPFIASLLIGVLLQAALLGRAARMNAPVVFIALLFWGTLWGPWGLLLAMPIMVAIKSVCDRVDGLRGFGELMSGNGKPVWR